MSKERVMEKLVEECRQAYQAKKPLIFVDTEYITLMDRLARESKVVDLQELKEAAYGDRQLYYYRYVGELPGALDRAANFFYDVSKLKDVTDKGSRLDFNVTPVETQLKDAQKKGGCLGVYGNPVMVVVHLFEQNPTTMQYLRRYVHSYVRCADNSSALRRSCVLLYGDVKYIPPDLLPYTEILTVDYPSQAEIREVIIQITRENGKELEEDVVKEVAMLMVGFSLPQVEEYTRRLLWLDGQDNQPLLFFPARRKKVLLDAKAQAIRSTGNLLTLYRDKTDGDRQNNPGNADGENNLGGMKAYKKWAKEAGDHTNHYSEYALTRGVPAMKGVLLCGVPGCGKSEAAKILWREWGIPMLRLDIDQLMGGILGESERNLRQALALAEAMAPCIVWIDEIEKGFSGASASHEDGGTFKRMFGRLLTWMQENTNPCFIFATANDISSLPPEFFRSGRFDALFAVYMPTNEECKDIFKEHMRRADKLRKDTAAEQGNPSPNDLFDDFCFNDSVLQSIMDDLVQDGDHNPRNPETIKFLSGADIAKITVNALKKIPLDHLNTPITSTDWLAAVKAVIHDSSLTTQGGGYAKLDKIAACYARLMREDFAPVSEKRQCLFNKESFKRNEANGVIQMTYSGQCPLDTPYDKALFGALKNRIERIAGRIETNELERDSR